MSSSRAYIVACALCLPVVVVAAGIAQGHDVALGAAGAGLALVGNLLLAEQALRAWLLRLGTADAGGAAVLLGAKQLATLPLAALLVWSLGPMPVLYAATALALGAVVLAAAHAVRQADVSHVVALESRC